VAFGLAFFLLCIRSDFFPYCRGASLGRCVAEPAHALETALFIYSADTAMFDGILKLLSSNAKLILCDTNGEEEGGVHMSPAELIAAAQELGPATIDRLRGIHMSKEIHQWGVLRFAQPGEEYILE